MLSVTSIAHMLVSRVHSLIYNFQILTSKVDPRARNKQHIGIQINVQLKGHFFFIALSLLYMENNTIRVLRIGLHVYHLRRRGHLSRVGGYITYL